MLVFYLERIGKYVSYIQRWPENEEEYKTHGQIEHGHTGEGDRILLTLLTGFLLNSLPFHVHIFMFYHGISHRLMTKLYFW